MNAQKRGDCFTGRDAGASMGHDHAEHGLEEIDEEENPGGVWVIPSRGDLSPGGGMRRLLHRLRQFAMTPGGRISGFRSFQCFSVSTVFLRLVEARGGAKDAGASLGM
jgi:hypothetical protein